eukprot:scaffold229804_cov16-Tisochrysis_lutea.AAC.1
MGSPQNEDSSSAQKQNESQRSAALSSRSTAATHGPSSGAAQSKGEQQRAEEEVVVQRGMKTGREMGAGEGFEPDDGPQDEAEWKVQAAGAGGVGGPGGAQCGKADGTEQVKERKSRLAGEGEGEEDVADGSELSGEEGEPCADASGVDYGIRREGGDAGEGEMEGEAAKDEGAGTAGSGGGVAADETAAMPAADAAATAAAVGQPHAILHSQPEATGRKGTSTQNREPLRRALSPRVAEAHRQIQVWYQCHVALNCVFIRECREGHELQWPFNGRGALTDAGVLACLVNLNHACQHARACRC